MPHCLDPLKSKQPGPSFAQLTEPATISVNTTSPVLWTEAWFSYVGTPIGRAVLEVAAYPVDRFALDNLTYTATAPIPGAILLLGSGLSCLAIYRRRKMNAKN